MRLFEAIAALGLQMLVLADMSAALTAISVTARSAVELHDRLASTRQIEHLIDRAVSSAARGPSSPTALTSTTRSRLVIEADQDGDRAIDRRTAEHTAFELRAADNHTQRLLHQIGRQAMTVAIDLEGAAHFSYWNRFGATTAAASAITLIAVPIDDRELLAALPPDEDRKR